MQLKKILALLFLFPALLSCNNLLHAQPATADNTTWKAHWITSTASQSATNTWICFRKEMELSDIPHAAIARIAVDSKYWLWINGVMVVFEGGLKRGPDPEDTYYDAVDLAPYLHSGKNTIALLLWYFGKDGFSHNSSGKAALLFDCAALNVFSDTSWKARLHPAYTSLAPLPNFRLPESSLLFDARRDIGNWVSQGFTQMNDFEDAEEIGVPPCSPWNHLVKRPIPQWKNSGLKDYESIKTLPGDSVDTIVCKLPYNAQITPYLKVSAPAGLTILLQTDHYHTGSTVNLRAGYITREGEQEYESPGWLNGDTMFYLAPAKVKILSLKYRETGYNSVLAGSFSSNDSFLNRLWQKSQRTLYVTMRDTYMDCPDRERAQWIGDEVNESGEAFYALDTVSHWLQRKGMYELMGWQRADSSLFAPVPAGNWNEELPDQILAELGYYGFWNYYLYTGDLRPVADLFGGVKKYLNLWKINNESTLILRKGTWGDWGEDIDIELLDNAWYYLALKGAAYMAEALGKNQEAARYRQSMQALKAAFNRQFWKKNEYRSADYHLATDDRAQALAVVSGLADEDKYPAILQVLKKEEHASPYMEKYVLEALFKMGYAWDGLARMKKRFGPMADNPDYTTLFEGWKITDGSVNHAWSGGCLTILSQYVCGVSPVEPGYKTFEIKPRMGNLTRAAAEISTVRGRISVSIKKSPAHFFLSVTIPENTACEVYFPSVYPRILLNGKRVKAKKQPGFNSIKVTAGRFQFEAKRQK